MRDRGADRVDGRRGRATPVAAPPAAAGGSPGGGEVLRRVAVVWVGALAVWGLVALLRQALLPRVADGAVLVTQGVVTAVLTVLLVRWAQRRVAGRPLRAIDLPPRRRDGAALMAGAAGWTLFAVAGLWLTVLAGWVEVRAGGVTAGVLGLLLLRAVSVFLFEALPEELVFRGCLLDVLAARLPRWTAVGAQAVLFLLFGFTLVTASGWLGAEGAWQVGWDRVVLFLSFGVVLALCRIVSGSLWASIGFHWAFQSVAQTYSAAGPARLGVSEEAPGTVEVVAFWFLPIVVGGAVLALLARRRPHAATPG